MKHFFLAIGRYGALAAFMLFSAGCETITDVGTAVGEASGTITEDQGESIRRGAKAVAKTVEDITPEQEYYIGRSVAATVLHAYTPYDVAKVNTYLNEVGQSLAMVSDKPETFGGYRFLVLDSDEINAFAAPGGFIFISRGMLRLCSNEDELAAVLAHEIGHVQLEHGLRAIKSSRLTSAFTIIAAESAKQFGSESLRDLTTAFEGSISDITQTMMNSGYARRLENEADAACITILRRIGYDPYALTQVLEAMSKNLKPGGRDFAKTHPDPKVRIADLRRIQGGSVTLAPPSPERKKRFEAAMRGI